MSRKKTKRKVYAPSLPRGLRPRLEPGQVFGLDLFNLANLDAIVSGDGSETNLQQYCLGCYMWAQVAELLGAGLEEMAEQVKVAEALINRFRETGRIEFGGAEYETAKNGVNVMSELAKIVDSSTLLAALRHSEIRLEQLRIVDEPVQRAK